MDFPFFSSHEIWRYLSTSQIGFYTHRTSKSIPNKPGIYAWFLPLDIDDTIENVIQKFIPRTKSGELHIMITHGSKLYISVTTDVFQSYNNTFYEYDLLELFK